MTKQLKDSSKDFERALTEKGKAAYLLRLYVTGTTPKSVQAISNIKQICEKHLKGRYELEVIDIYQEPKMAKRHQIVVLPTLIKELPAPLRRIIGTGMGIEPERMKTLFEFGKSHKGSSGVGLYYCRMFVQDNGGSLTVTSPGKGRGATVAIRLPS